MSQSAKERLIHMLDHGGADGKPLSNRDRTTCLSSLARIEEAEHRARRGPPPPIEYCPHCHKPIRDDVVAEFGMLVVTPIPPHLRKPKPEEATP